MNGTPDQMVAVVLALGECEIATSSRNWSTLHDTSVIVIATMPPVIATVGQRIHAHLDAAFHAATPNPMDGCEPDQVCVVSLPASVLLPLLSCFDRVRRLQAKGELLLVGADGEAERLNEQIVGARASFYEYLRSRDVGAEVLFGEESR